MKAPNTRFDNNSRKTIDVLIATFCIENGHKLLHSDRDFDVMVDVIGLRVL